MSFLLDTNICSAFVKQPSRLAHRFIQHTGNLATTTVALAELYTWAFRRSDPTGLLESISTELLNEVGVIGFDQGAAKRFGQVRALLLSMGVGIDAPDLMIAAVALEHDLTLVTNNVRHFEPVPGLRVEDWLS